MYKQLKQGYLQNMDFDIIYKRNQNMDFSIIYNIINPCFIKSISSQRKTHSVQVFNFVLNESFTRASITMSPRRQRIFILLHTWIILISIHYTPIYGSNPFRCLSDSSSEDQYWDCICSDQHCSLKCINHPPNVPTSAYNVLFSKTKQNMS